MAHRYTRPVDAVISSPPYANRLADTYVDDDPQRMSYEMGKAKIDAVVSSPPYEGQITDPHDRKRSIDETKWGDGRAVAPPHSQVHLDHNYGQAENIGNLKGQAYWDSMFEVYQECYRVLRPGGIMALVLKGFTREGEYVDLPQQTADLVESLGFVKFDEWRRELWSLSFWRILQRRRDPAAFDDRLNYETVLAFRKEAVLP